MREIFVAPPLGSASAHALSTSAKPHIARDRDNERADSERIHLAQGEMARRPPDDGSGIIVNIAICKSSVYLEG
jgi:hypothetical protein